MLDVLSVRFPTEPPAVVLPIEPPAEVELVVLLAKIEVKVLLPPLLTDPVTTRRALLLCDVLFVQPVGADVC